MTTINTPVKSKYDTTIVTKNTQGVVTDILFTGFDIKLSDLVNQFPNHGGSSLVIYADTITVDVPNFNAQGVILVARVIDISSLDGESWPIEILKDDTSVAFECLLMDSVSNGSAASLSFVTTSHQNTPFFTAPTNATTLSVGEFMLCSDGTTKISQTNANYVLDLIGKPYTLPSLFASFSYAVDQLNIGNDKGMANAKSALRWICNSIGGCGAIPDTHKELYSQASALLLMLNVPANYHYLGVLSADFYKKEIDNFIASIEDYNTNLLEIGKPSKTLEDIYTALANTASTEKAPTHTELAQVSGAIRQLQSEISSLTQEFSTQLKLADTTYDVMIGSIQSAQITKFVKDGIKTGVDIVGSVFKIAGAVEKGGKGAGEAASSVVETITQGYETISGITETFNHGDLITDAKNLLGNTQSMLDTVFTSYQIWNNSSTSTSEINFKPASVTANPNLAWDNFMARAKNVLSNLAVSLNDSGLSSVQDKANDYLASLNILANYGKAINTQIFAYSNQLCRGVVLQSKLSALNNIQAIWQKLNDQAKHEEEKLAAMRSLVQSRIDACKRSIYIAWENYRSAYLYNKLSEPSETISLDTPVADMQAAFASITSWVAGLPGNGGSGTTTLPNENSKISLKIPVVNTVTGTADIKNAEPAGLLAHLTPANGTKEATISLVIPKKLGQFADQINLGSDEDVVMWVTKGKFFIEGIKHNKSGYVPLTIATSGIYVNGFGNDLLHFASNPISSRYTYKPDVSMTSSTVIVPWSIDSHMYMLPTPFTEWTISISKDCDISGITELYMEFHVNFLVQNV